MPKGKLSACRVMRGKRRETYDKKRNGNFSLLFVLKDAKIKLPKNAEFFLSFPPKEDLLLSRIDWYVCWQNVNVFVYSFLKPHSKYWCAVYFDAPHREQRQRKLNLQQKLHSFDKLFGFCETLYSWKNSYDFLFDVGGAQNKISMKQKSINLLAW